MINGVVQAHLGLRRREGEAVVARGKRVDDAQPLLAGHRCCRPVLEIARLPVALGRVLHRRATVPANSIYPEPVTLDG